MCGMAAPRLTTMTFGGTSKVAIDTNGRDVVIAGALETNWVRAAHLSIPCKSDAIYG
jgi:hypothetical protein